MSMTGNLYQTSQSETLDSIKIRSSLATCKNEDETKKSDEARKIYQIILEKLPNNKKG